MQFKIRDYQGNTLDEAQETKMMQDVARVLLKNPASPFFYTMTGNTLVMGIQEDMGWNATYIEVFQTKIERHMTPNDLNDFFTV
jgi:hypothetical protein